MSRNVVTVSDAWREYTIGLNGKPPVKAMYVDNQTRRFSSESERKYFTERRVIYTAVEAMAELRGISAAETAALFDSYRQTADPERVLSLKDLVGRIRAAVKAKTPIL